MRCYHCPCGQCRIRRLQGPLMLITVGVLFTFDRIWGRWSFSETWPVILIVMGLVKVFERLASDAGHVGRFIPDPQQRNTGDPNNAA